ncbi:MAG: AAA family ATPase [Candidatus Riflebacteria bacterium]|nr:AAA family ATPase [Candidatus Riflebacteria bacterium]
MNIRRLVLENYRQFPNLDLLLPFRPGQPITLIKGKNGFGKSNLLHAFNLAFNGFPANEDEARSLISLSRGSAFGRPTRICVELQVGPGEVCAVERILTVAPEGNPPRLLRSNVLTRPDGSQEGNEDRIREYLGNHLPLELLEYFMFNLEYSQTLERLIEDHEGAAVVDALEEILGLHLFRRLQDDLEICLKEIRRQIQSNSPPPAQLEQERADLERALRSAESRLSNLRKERDQIDRELAEAVTRKDALLKNFNPELDKRRQGLERRKAEVELELKKIGDLFQEHVDLHLPLRLLGPLLPRAIDLAENAASIFEGREDAMRRREIAQAIAEDLARGGPPLSGPLDDQGRDVLFQRLLKILAIEVFEGEEPTPPCLSSREIRKMREVIQKAGQGPALAQLLDERDALRDERNRILREIPTLTQDQNLGRRINEVLADIEGLGASRSDRVTLIERERAEIQRLRAQVKAKEEEIDQAIQENEEAEVATRKIEFIGRIRQCVDELAQEQRLGKVQAIEEAATSALLAITNKPGYYRRILLDRKTFDIKLENVRGELVAKQRLSTGEKSVLAFSVLRALQEASTWKVPLVIEAPLTPMDDEHTQNILGKFLPQLGEQVLLLIKTGELSPSGERALDPYVNQVYELQRPTEDKEETILQEMRKEA